MTARWDGDCLLLDCRIQPRASRDEFAGLLDGAIKIRITAPPVDGEANQQLLRFLAKAFGVPQKRVQLLRGEQGRSKTVRIEQPQQLPPGLGIPDR
ncbi:MAG: YggU family protein [Gammaproteobacteria bacterium]|nr:MAG: YggU family protein [Gammaproteobacteria bacterium]